MSKVKVDEVLRFMRDEASKVSSDYTVPRSALFGVEFSLDVLSDILLDAEFLHCVLCDFNGFLLHILAHVNGLDLGLQLHLLLREGLRGGHGLERTCCLAQG